jgi:hypothetical protein
LNAEEQAIIKRRYSGLLADDASTNISSGEASSLPKVLKKKQYQ